MTLLIGGRQGDLTLTTVLCRPGWVAHCSVLDVARRHDCTLLSHGERT